MNSISRVAAMMAAVMLSAGCATTGEVVLPGEQTQLEQIVRTGVVENVREVTIENTRPNTGAGGAIGAVVGGIVGSQIGRASSSTVSSIIGAVLGGLAGQAAEQQGGRQAGLEIAIKLDDGRAVSIVQTAEEQFRPGDRVRIISDGITARVTR